MLSLCFTELTPGLRRGEICGLRWQDFDMKTGRLKIRRAVTSRKGSFQPYKSKYRKSAPAA